MTTHIKTLESLISGRVELDAVGVVGKCYNLQILSRMKKALNRAFIVSTSYDLSLPTNSSASFKIFLTIF